MHIKKNLKLTKASSENVNHVQCYHNNVGYCRYRDQCRYPHYTEICQRSICRDSRCKYRHPKTCKHGERCKFLKRNCCVYSHNTVNSNEISKKDYDLKKKEAATLNNEVKELKIEVVNLRKECEMREQNLKELSETIASQNRMILKLKTDNSDLKSQLSELHSKIDEQTKLIESKDEIINAKSDELSKLRGDFKCDKCNFCTSNLTLLVKHKANDHKPKTSCDMCTFKSGKESDLQLHMVLRH